MIFRGEAALELVTLNRGHRSTRYASDPYRGYEYSSSPFASCVEANAQAVCVSYLPGATVEGERLSFGGRFGRGSFETLKAVRMIEAMLQLGYDRAALVGEVVVERDGALFSCVYSRSGASCTLDATAEAVLELSFEELPRAGAGLRLRGLAHHGRRARSGRPLRRHRSAQRWSYRPR